jgi:iron-sulfur cluster assembly protein
MQPTITLTESASTYIKKIIEKEQGIGFRLSIKKTGCSGYSYVPSVIHKINSDDCVIETSSGLAIFIDAAWLSLLQNLNVDYVEEEKSGLKQKRLIFSNPNEASRCGCGESFTIATETQHVS